MSDSSKVLIVHRKSAAEAVLDIRGEGADGAQSDKGQRPVSVASRRTIVAAFGLVMLMIIMGANISKIQTTYQRPFKKESSSLPSPLQDDPSEIHSRQEALKLQGRLDMLRAELQEANQGRFSSGSSFYDSQKSGGASNMQQPVQESSSIAMIPQQEPVVSKQKETAAISNAHAHLLSFINTLNSAGRNMRSDCDDPDFKDADLVSAFLGKKVDVCKPPTALQQSGAQKISSSHIVCYQHQQARHSATDSICEGHNLALHLPSFEGSGMSAFVEATWMNMKQGALQAACTPTGPYTKDKFPLCLGDWFVSGFRQVLPRLPLSTRRLRITRHVAALGV